MALNVLKGLRACISNEEKWKIFNSFKFLFLYTARVLRKVNKMPQKLTNSERTIFLGGFSSLKLLRNSLLLLLL